MGICMTTDTMTPDSVENDTEIQTISKSIPSAKGVPLGIPFSKFNWSDESNNITTFARDSSDPVFVIDASAVANLPTLNDSPIKKNYNELPKRIPLVIQRTIKESDIYNIPKINIIFVLDAEMQRSEIITNLKHLTEISGRLHHVDMMPIFLEVVSTIGSQDTDMIPPSKALEVFINRISSEIINVDAVLVTGYPRNMRDVVEYMARVQRISGVILLKDPNFQLFECDDDSTNNDDPNKEFKIMSDATDEQLSHFRSSIFPVIQFFKQEELLHMVTLERSFLEIFHDIYDKVLLILSRLPQSPTHEIMTEEKEVVDATTLTSPVRNNSSISREVSSKERSRIKSSNLHQKALNKDVRDVLSLVQAGSIMERVSSVNAKSRKK